MFVAQIKKKFFNVYYAPHSEVVYRKSKIRVMNVMKKLVFTRQLGINHTTNEGLLDYGYKSIILYINVYFGAILEFYTVTMKEILIEPCKNFS